MGDGVKEAVNRALELLFPVIARWLLQAGFSVRDAVELLRAAYVLEAQRSIPEGIDPGKSQSLVSTRTGLSRAKVRKILAGVKRKGKAAARGGHRGERALAGWWHDRDFRDGMGRPRVLPISKGPNSFAELCRRHSGGDRQFPTILKDLEQAGAVKVLPGDRVKVLRQNYAAVAWTEAGQIAMAEQLAEHLETHLHNFLHPDDTEQWVCRRVVNPQVKHKYAGILARDLKAQIEDKFATFFDAVTDPVHTASPDDPSDQPEHLSVTAYITRKPSSICESSKAAVRAAVSDSRLPRRLRRPSKHSAKERR
ncbi:MAG: DUF6502 family protein [Steroidobacteraceae bacterium]